MGGWYGVYGPKGMAPELVAKLNKAVNAARPAGSGKSASRNWATTNGQAAPRKLAERAAKERAMWATVTQGIVID